MVDDSETLSTEKKYEVDNWALMGYYAACSGNSLPTFWDNLSVPKFLYEFTTVRCVTARKSAVLIHFAAEASNKKYGMDSCNLPPC